MKTLILLAALLNSAAFAGGTEGHGADAIVCRVVEEKIVNGEKIITKKIVKKEIDGIEYPTLSDYDEGFRIGKTVDLGPKNLSIREKFNKMIGRVARFSPTWAKKLHDDGQIILGALEGHTPGKVEVINGVEFTNRILKDVPDDDIASYPEGCDKEQFVIRSSGNIPDESAYAIKRDILEASDNDIVAGMVFHEVVFKHSVETEKILKSPGSRYIVRNFAAPQADTYSYGDYALLLTKAKFNYILIELGRDVLGKPIVLYHMNLVKRDDGFWEASLADTLHLSNGFEAKWGRLVFSDDKTPNEELTRLANPRTLSLDLSMYRNRLDATLKIGGQECNAYVAEGRKNSSYTYKGCRVRLPRGVYDYEISFNVRDKVYLVRWDFQQNKSDVPAETRNWFWSDKPEKRPVEGYFLHIDGGGELTMKPEGVKRYPQNKVTGRVRIE